VRHEADVADDHDEVAHDCCASTVVDVNSYAPNERPVTVTDAKPQVGELRLTRDTTGASKLMPSSAVPATAPTVTCASCTVDAAACDKHPTDVLELQVAV
jgi:hypothetical protein